MQLSTHFGNLDTASSVKSDVADAMLLAIGNFQPSIRKVNVSFTDVNGPKGGEDLRCRCVVHLKRMAPIVIEETGDNLQKVLNRVGDRVSYTLSQKIDRVKKTSRSRKTRERADTLFTSLLAE